MSPTEPTAAGGAPRIVALDGLRAFAMLLVLVMHDYTIIPTYAGSAPHEFFKRVFSLGYSGVDLFFVLSGFLIGGILLDHRSSPRLLPAFYARRFFRIVPIYLLLLASFFICRQIPGLRATNDGAYFQSTVPLWCYFLFVQNIAMGWIPSVGPYWLGASWTLGIEEQFYLAAPLVIRRFTARSLIWVCVLVIVISPLLRLNTLYRAHNSFAAVFLLIDRADGLMWGVLCACLVRENPAREWLQRHGRLLVGLVVAGAVVFAYASACQLTANSRPMLGWGYSFLSAWFAFIVLGVVLFPSSRASRLLSWRPLVALGMTSYFSYLFHWPILFFLHWLFFNLPPQHGSWLTGSVTLLAVLCTFTAAWASWRWFEGPLLRLGRRHSYE